MSVCASTHQDVRSSTDSVPTRRADTFHKPGFKMHARILNHLFSVASGNVVKAPLWDVAAKGGCCSACSPVQGLGLCSGYTIADQAACPSCTLYAAAAELLNIVSRMECCGSNAILLSPCE